jgi:hypothetical protein
LVQLRTALLALLALPLLAPAPTAALPAGTDMVVVTNNGEYTAAANSFYCPGRTFDLVVVAAAVGADMDLLILADGGPDCKEVWGPIRVHGSWAQGWSADCNPLPPLPCPELTLGPRDGGVVPLVLRGTNIGLRTGHIVVATGP